MHHSSSNTQSKDRHSALQTHGGVAGLAKALHTDLERGLAVPAHSPHNVQHDELLDVAWDAHEIPLAARQAAFGINALPIVPPKTLFELWSGNLLDPIILLLIVAATVCMGDGGRGIIDGHVYCESYCGMYIVNTYALLCTFDAYLCACALSHTATCILPHICILPQTHVLFLTPRCPQWLVLWWQRNGSSVHGLRGWLYGWPWQWSLWLVCVCVLLFCSIWCVYKRNMCVVFEAVGTCITKHNNNNNTRTSHTHYIHTLYTHHTAAWNDWRKDQQFAVLNRQRAVVHVKVVRDGMEQLVASPHIIVGDVVLLDTGRCVAL